MPTSQGTLRSKATVHKNLNPVLICLALAIITVITFWSLKDCGFVNYDDAVYVYENAYVQSGLNANSIRQAFSSELVEKSFNWHPLTWLSLMLDYQIFSLNPQGFHLINLFFHILNTILLFLILRRMTKTLWPSVFVAALFAIHPLHVESVAWIAERKDVLSTFFWMLTMGAYSHYVENRGLRRYCLVLLFFVLGLMAKPMLVTLPFVLLLLDYWPLQRFQEITGIKPSAARDCSTYPIPLRSAFGIGVSTIKQDNKIQTEVFKPETSDKQKKKSKKKQAVKETLEVKKPANPEYKWSLIYPLLWEKVPLFALAILSSIVTYIAQQKGGAVVSLEAFPLGVRIGNAFVSYIAYIGKMIWPSNLAVFYPQPEVWIPWQVFGSVLLLIVITVAVIWMIKKAPYLATGWLWYIGTLVPVIGIVQVGGQSMADRYTYIPLIGLFIMVAWGVPLLFSRENLRKKILFPAGLVVLVILTVLTWKQCGNWKNSITLSTHALQVTKDNYKAYYIRGDAYNDLRQYQRAIDDFNETIRLKPYYIAYNNRGLAYENLGQHQRAIEDYNEAIRLKPDYGTAYYNRGFIYYDKLRQYQRAIDDFNETIRLKPDDADAYYLRGIAYGILGNNDLSCRDARKVCELGNCKLLEAANTRGLCH